MRNLMIMFGVIFVGFLNPTPRTAWAGETTKEVKEAVVEVPVAKSEALKIEARAESRIAIGESIFETTKIKAAAQRQIDEAEAEENLDTAKAVYKMEMSLAKAREMKTMEGAEKRLKRVKDTARDRSWVNALTLGMIGF